jgi:hypothetical protein
VTAPTESMGLGDACLIWRDKPDHRETEFSRVRPRVVTSRSHTDDLRPPKIRSTKEGFGGHWQRLDFGTPTITWLMCWPQPAHVALPHLRQVTCRHIGRSSSRVDRTSNVHYTPWGIVNVAGLDISPARVSRLLSAAYLRRYYSDIERGITRTQATRRKHPILSPSTETRP